MSVGVLTSASSTDRIVRENFLFWSGQVIGLGHDLLSDNSVLDTVQQKDMAGFNRALARQTAANYYFCFALGKVLRWLDRIRDARLAGNHDFSLIDSRRSDWKDVRDMLEHDDEYLLGGGRAATRYEEYAIGPIRVTAHATTITKGGVFRTKPDGTTVDMHDQYSIGGRVDVGEALDCIAAVVEALEKNP